MMMMMVLNTFCNNHSNNFLVAGRVVCLLVRDEIFIEENRLSGRVAFLLT